MLSAQTSLMRLPRGSPRRRQCWMPTPTRHLLTDTLRMGPVDERPWVRTSCRCSARSTNLHHGLQSDDGQAPVRSNPWKLAGPKCIVGDPVVTGSEVGAHDRLNPFMVPKRKRVHDFKMM